MDVLLKALALLLIIEGLFYAVFPLSAKEVMRKIIDTPQENLKTVGMVVTIIGLIILWVLR